jgi:hypothetical protein
MKKEASGKERKKLWKALKIGNDTRHRLFELGIETTSSDRDKVVLCLWALSDFEKGVVNIRRQGFDPCIVNDSSAQMALKNAEDSFSHLFEQGRFGETT